MKTDFESIIRIIAPTYDIANRIAHEEGVHPTMWRFVPENDPTELRGLSDAVVWIVRGSKLSSHTSQTLKMLKDMGYLSIERYVGERRTFRR